MMRVALRSYRSIITLCLLLVAGLIISVTHSQTLDCPTIPNNIPGFPRDAKVYYSLDPNMNSEQQRQVLEAIRLWNEANQTNRSNVQFLPAPPPAGTNNPITLAIRNGYANGSPADTISTPQQIDANGNRTGAEITFDGSIISENDNMYLKIALHELGHCMGLDHTPVNNQPPYGGQTPGASVMNRAVTPNDAENISPTEVTECDKQSVRNAARYQPPPDPCNPNDRYNCQVYGYIFNNNTCRCEDDAGQCVRQTCSDLWHWDWDNCTCLPGQYCPVVIDVEGDGYNLTDGPRGVRFDLDNNGTAERLSWTSAETDDAWLALDRNNNGTIDNGAELFGNYTPQRPSTEPNGFLALSEFDTPAQGGNQDAVIDQRDSVFANLRLWQDRNHNGRSEAGELHTLPSLGVARIELDYRESRRRDRNGNEFRYRARVIDGSGQQIGRWAWDVFLSAAP